MTSVKTESGSEDQVLTFGSLDIFGMLLPILLAAFLLPAQVASMPCANIAATQTQPVRGRDAMSAILKVTSKDDDSKNSHDCEAEYQLLMTPGLAGAPLVVGLLTSDAEWDRSLSLRLNGFSQDGRQVFGILSEGGKSPSTTLFDYDTADGKMLLIDLKKPLAHSVAAKCRSTFDVIGTAASGAIVLQVNSANCLAANDRWLLSPSGEKAQRLPPDATFLSLYEFKNIGR
ncbi:MAG: hypothetical protein WCA13_15410 [Terriglobales bacterium]